MGFGGKGEHLSFHKSGQIHYKDEDGKITILNKIGSNELLIKFFKDTLEPFQDMTSPERKFFTKLIEKTESTYIDNGCFDPNCKNTAGMAFDFDKLMELTVEYLNKNKKMFFQLFGPIENTIEPDEDTNEEEPFDIISTSFKLERIPDCKYCIGKSKIQYKKKNFVWVKCPRCGGLGLEVRCLDDYKID